MWTFLANLHGRQKEGEDCLERVQTGNARSVQQPRKKAIIAITQLKNDLANCDITSRLEYIRRMALFQGAAHSDEILHP